MEERTNENEGNPHLGTRPYNKTDVNRKLTKWRDERNGHEKQNIMKDERRNRGGHKERARIREEGRIITRSGEEPYETQDGINRESRQ
jgi:hypothetical protein